MEKALVVGRVRRAGGFIGKLAVCAAAVGSFVAGAVVNAHAALTLTGITLNTADVESIMMLVIPGLAALWGFRKIVKTMNRS